VLDSNTVLIRSLTTLGGVVILAIVALAIWGSPNNPQVNSAISTIVTIVTVLIAGLLSLKGSSDAKQEATKSKDASRANTAALNDIDGKVTKAVDGVDGVHQIVNSQREAMIKKADAQDKQIQDLHAAIARLENTLTAERANPPSVDSDGTPAHGTTIAPGGPTTINVDPASAVVMTKDGTP
jgi:outer membrane murein-binding lipoprotein Lpp